MTIELLEDPISESINELLTIFQNQLSSVTFPDITADVLQNCAEQVRNKARELQDAQAKVLNAREALESSQNELLQKAVRALAYAKVYAEDHEELFATLSTITLGGRTLAARKKNQKNETMESTTDEAGPLKRHRSRKDTSVLSESSESQ